MSHFLVFAYGSNLVASQMVRRCPSARAVMLARVPGYVLNFAGFSFARRGPTATIDQSSRGRVAGVIYRVTLGDLRRLDAYEGVPSVYERIEVIAHSTTDQIVPAFAYRLPRGSARVFWPSAEYLSLIRRGYDDWGLPKRAIVRALNRTEGRTLLDCVDEKTAS